MKKITIVLLLVLLLVPTLSVFGEGESNKNAVSMDPIQILFNYWSFSYERALTDKISIKANVAYSPNFLWISDVSYFDLVVEGRYYWGSHLSDFAKDLPLGQEVTGKIFADALSGLYAGVFAGVVTASIDDWTEDTTTFDASFKGAGAGLTIGCKYALTGENFVFFGEPFGGVRFYTPVGGENGWTYTDTTSNDSITRPGDFDDGFTRIGPFGGINFGLSF